MFPLVTVCEKILFAGLEIRMSSLVLLVFPRVPSCRMTERAIGYLCTHVIVKGQQNCLSHIFLHTLYEDDVFILGLLQIKFCSYHVPS